MNQILRGKLLWGITLCVLVFSSLAAAQSETGAVMGTVTDPTGAVVPEAKITVKNVATGALRVTTSSSAGVYNVTNLQPAQYSVRFEHAGFEGLENVVTVGVGARVTVDAQLVVGKTGTVVEVSASAEAVNSESQTLSTTVSQTELREFPTLTRNPYSLLSTSGNVSDAGAGGRGAGFSINGQRESGTNVLLDGSANNNEFTAGVGQSVPLDSIQEFSVLTGNFTAEFGRASGGVVNVVTKSGTNEFHGTAYEFNRVSRLASNGYNNNAYEIPRPVFTRNQPGYSLGGPAVKNKLFFFSSTEWTRIRSMATTQAFIPDPAFIAAMPAASQSFFNAYGKLDPGAHIVQSYSINQLAAAGTNLCGTAALCKALNPDLPVYDLVNFSAPGDAGGGSPQDQYQTVARVDYNLSERTQMYGRYALQGITYTPGYVSSSPYNGYNTGETDFNNNALFSVTHMFTPRLVSQSKVVFNRLNQQQPLNSVPVPTMYTSGNGSNTLLGQYVFYPGYTPTSPGNGIPFGGPQNFVQIYEDLSITFGKHSLRWGGSFEYLRDNRTFGAYETAGMYLGSGSLGSAVNGLMSGTLNGFQTAINPQGHFPGETVSYPLTQPNFSRSNRYKESALYVQDSYKVAPRLTLNLGLRWEYYGVQHNKNPNLESNFYFPSNEVFTPQGFVDGSVKMTAAGPANGGLWAPDYKDFAPRLGFAWDVFGDGKTSLRGGYGIGYERNFGNVTFNSIQNPPNYETVSIKGTAANPIPISPSNLGPFAATTGTLKLPAATLRVPIQDMKTAYSQMWSASIERQVNRNVLVAGDYSGSKGSRLYDVSVANRYGYGNVFLGIPCTYDAGDCTAKLNNQYSGINTRGNNGFSNYNSITARTRIDNLGNSGLHLNFNYTWSHAIDNLSTSFSDADNGANNWGQFQTGMYNPFDPNASKGSADFDIRHRVVVSAIWDIPVEKTGHGLAAQLLGGWSIAPIFTAHTGSPYSIFDCTNAYNLCSLAAFNTVVNGSANSNPAPAAGPNNFTYFAIPASVDYYTNPKYFYSDLPPFPSNMSGRNAFRSPGNWNMDLGVYKTFRLGERFRVQLRGEGYNFFNHANLFVSGASADVSSTSYIPATKSGRRDVQLAAKIIF